MNPQKWGLWDVDVVEETKEKPEPKVLQNALPIAAAVAFSTLILASAAVAALVVRFG